LERQWLARLGLTLSAPAVTSARADRIAESIRRAAEKPGVQVVSLKIYAAPAPAPALVLAVARPTFFLRHQLKPILSRLGDPRYLRIVDAKAKRVLEWYGAPARGALASEGALGVRHGLEGCSPIVALGWSRIPPCPSK
jgi:hypothetical protein